MRDKARAGRDTKDNVRSGELPKQGQRRSQKATRAGGTVEWEKSQRRGAAPRRDREETQEEVQL